MKDIEVIPIKSDDIIVHTFDCNKSSVEEVNKIHSGLLKRFPDHTVISVPDSSSIDALDKQSTIDFLKGTIYSLENN